MAWWAASRHAVIALDGKTCHEKGGLEYCASDEKCHPDGICSECDGRLTEDTDNHECIDRVVFNSHVVFDAISLVIWLVGAGLAVSAGVGGGGIFVPLGVILLRFAPKSSTGLSQVSIFGATLAGLILNIRARHPMADRPLIDLDMALFLAPLQMAGALLGVIVQTVLPTWAVIVAMAVILAFTATKTFQKGCQTWKKERAAQRAVKENIENIDHGLKKAWEEEPSARSPNESKDLAHCSSPIEPIKHQETGVSDASMTPVVPATLEKSRSAWSILNTMPTAEEWIVIEAKTPYWNIGYLILMWAVLIVILILKGGKGTKGAFEYCSTGYWICTAMSFVWLFGFALCMGRRTVNKTIQKSKVNFKFVEGDIVWNWFKFRKYSCFTFLAGCIAGLIGIGGGMVLGPMMLQLGVLPQVSSATNAALILLTASAAAMLYLTSGQVPTTYAITFFIVAFVGAFSGKIYIDRLVKRYGLTSIIVLILACIITFASAMMTVNGILIYSDRNWNFDGMQDVC